MLVDPIDCLLLLFAHDPAKLGLQLGNVLTLRIAALISKRA
jgi:hypothetical protein